MSNPWLAIAPGPDGARVLGMIGASNTFLKARLESQPADARALQALLEAIALWQGQKVHAAFCVADRERGFDSSLSRAAFVDFGGPLYSLAWTGIGPRARRRSRERGSLGDFADLKCILHTVGAR